LIFFDDKLFLMMFGESCGAVYAVFAGLFEFYEKLVECGAGA